MSLVPVSSLAEWPAGLRRGIAVLGSTGSIGTSALEVVRQHADKFQVRALAAGKNIDLLSAQVAEFDPAIVSVQDSALVGELKSRFPRLEVHCGREGLAAAATADGVDVVLAAVVGMAGLEGVLAALRAGKQVALANKESLVAGGALVARELAAGRGTIIPVDSEHSALFQALQGERRSQVKSLILTASGGPFLRRAKSEFNLVTPDEAVRHPRWSMGAKISVDSATLVNKALEVIEAHWLFSAPADQLRVLVHPESIIHSLVEFLDGSQIAQLSVPDMKGAIAYGLSYPYGRLAAVMKPLQLAQLGALHFEELDSAKFPAVTLALRALRRGGTAPAVFNAANEFAVAQFLAHRLRFDTILECIQYAVETVPATEYCSSAELAQLMLNVNELLARRFL